MKLIVGLGNPGPQYMMTRHNAGFWITDKLATKYGVEKFRLENKFNAYVMKIQIAGHPIWLAQPNTFMNGSGYSVREILNYYKIELSDFLVVHDDVALPLGKIRVQSAGGAGGQHGVEDIIQQLSHQTKFDRIKFGVGPDPGGDRRADFVLSSFPLDQVELKNKMVDIAAEAAEMWVRAGGKEAANKFNGLDLRPTPPPPEPPPAPPQNDETTAGQPIRDV